MRWLLSAALLLGPVACARSGPAAAAPRPSPSSAARSSPSPSASAAAARKLVKIDGPGLRALLDAQRGRPVLINVFASWCQPCREEMPEIDALGKEFPGLALIGLDVDAGEAEARGFLDKVPAHFKTIGWASAGIAPLLSVLRLPADWNEAMPPGWEKTVPLTLVFNRKGEFETGSVGRLSAEALAAMRDIARAP